MKNSVSGTDDELVEIPPFDFENSEPNKFAGRYDENAETVIYKSENARGVILDPDVAEHFPDSESVNIALRVLISETSKIRNLSGESKTEIQDEESIPRLKAQVC